MSRPSGATLFVTKRFENVSDCEIQHALLSAAPPNAVLKPFGLARYTDGGASFSMPLAQGRGFAREGVFEPLAHLWKASSQRACTREEYHDYVMRRQAGFSCYEEFPATFAQLRDEVHGFYGALVARSPVAQEAFVHGDATISNFVSLGTMVLAIDLSPRYSPPEIEIDFGKLWLSAWGFDLEGAGERANFTSHLIRTQREHGAQAHLVNYYRATHLLRVMAKEPPNDDARWAFYKKWSYECLQHRLYT